MNKQEKFQLELMDKDHKFQEKLMKKKFWEEKRIQRNLTIIIIIGMLVSGILSGLGVYWLSIDQDPYLIVSPYRTPNKTFDKLSIQIANIKETPATMIRVLYKIEEAEQWETAEPEIPYLDKGNDFIEIDFNKLDEQIIRNCEKILIEANSKEYDYVSPHKNYDLVFRISCNSNKCKDENILYTNRITYSREIDCWYTANKKSIDYNFDYSWWVSY